MVSLLEPSNPSNLAPTLLESSFSPFMSGVYNPDPFQAQELNVLLVVVYFTFEAASHLAGFADEVWEESCRQLWEGKAFSTV